MYCFLFEPKRTRTVHSLLRVAVWFLLTNAELSVQSQRVHCCAGSQESESTSPFRARTAPRLASADWKRQVTEKLALQLPFKTRDFKDHVLSSRLQQNLKFPFSAFSEKRAESPPEKRAEDSLGEKSLGPV